MAKCKTIEGKPKYVLTLSLEEACVLMGLCDLLCWGSHPDGGTAEAIYDALADEEDLLIKHVGPTGGISEEP